MIPKVKELLIVGIVAIIFLTIFNAFSILNRSHGFVGNEINQEDFTVEIEKKQRSNYNALNSV